MAEADFFDLLGLNAVARDVIGPICRPDELMNPHPTILPLAYQSEGHGWLMWLGNSSW